jgi:hypothetical protein
LLPLSDFERLAKARLSFDRDIRSSLSTLFEE